MMIGAVSQCPTLQTLEEVWTQHSTSLLPSLTPLLTKILMRYDQHLFLDMMKFTAMVCTEMYDKVEKELLEGFTERYLAAVHLTSDRYYNSHTFDQDRYLDCISAILSIWSDCTAKLDLVIPKFSVFTRGSQSHILDAILQSFTVSNQTKSQLLDQITLFSNLDVFVKYTIIGRQFDKHRLNSLTHQPTEDSFRCWLLKHNITAIRSVSEFLKNDKYDDDILSSMCRPFYNLPFLEDSSDTEMVEVEENVNPESLFFFDRGTKAPGGATSPEKSELTEGSGTKTKDLEDGKRKENESKSQDVIEPDKSCSPIKIRNLRRRRSKPGTPASPVIVLKCPKSEYQKPEPASLTKETLSSLPEEKSSPRVKSRTRTISEDSGASVDSIASRTRNRNKPAPLESLAAISEEDVNNKPGLGSVRKIRATPAAKQGTTREIRATPAAKLGTPREIRATPAAKLGTPREIRATPAAKQGTPRSAAVRKSPRKGAVEEAEETPQIPVRKTRRRVLDM